MSSFLSFYHRVAVIFGLPFFLIVTKGFLFPLPLLDFWWHLKMGSLIVAGGSIPRTDLFSYTSTGSLFIAQNWLAEVFYYGIFKLGGLPLLIILNAVLLTATLIFVLLLCRESTTRFRIASISALITCLALACNARPQVFSLFFFAFFYWILDGYRFKRRDALWILPPAMALWANTHGAFAVGLGLIAIYLGSESYRRWCNPTHPEVLSTRRLWKLAFVFAACIVATFINPETYRIYQYLQTVLADQASQRLVMEWQPPRDQLKTA